MLEDFDTEFGETDLPRNIMVLSLAKSYLKTGRAREAISAAEKAINSRVQGCSMETRHCCEAQEPSEDTPKSERDRCISSEVIIHGYKTLGLSHAYLGSFEEAHDNMKIAYENAICNNNKDSATVKDTIAILQDWATIYE